MPTPIDEQPVGIDAYHRTDIYNFDLLRRGTDFIILKASQVVEDQRYREFRAQAERVELVHGAYHFLSYEHNPVRQADLYLGIVGPREPGMLPYCLDCENDDDDPETGKQYSRAHMQDYIARFIARVEQQAGESPMLYTYPYFWRNVLANPTRYAKKCPLWIADYSHKRPALVGGWEFHTFHQFTSTGSAPGVRGRVDVNRFNGSLERLRILAST